MQIANKRPLFSYHFGHHFKHVYMKMKMSTGTNAMSTFLAAIQIFIVHTRRIEWITFYICVCVYLLVYNHSIKKMCHKWNEAFSMWKWKIRIFFCRFFIAIFSHHFILRFYINMLCSKKKNILLKCFFLFYFLIPCYFSNLGVFASRCSHGCGFLIMNVVLLYCEFNSFYTQNYPPTKIKLIIVRMSFHWEIFTSLSRLVWMESIDCID